MNNRTKKTRPTSSCIWFVVVAVVKSFLVTMLLSKASLRMAVKAWTAAPTTLTSRSLRCERFVQGRDRLLAASSSSLTTRSSIHLRSVSTQRNSAPVEEDLDAALDEILGEVYEEAAAPQKKTVGTRKKPPTTTVKKVSPLVTSLRNKVPLRVVAANQVEDDDDDDDDDDDSVGSWIYKAKRGA